MVQINGSPVNGESSLRNEIRALRAEITALKQAVEDPDAPRLLSVEAGADRLSVSERTLRSLLSDGTIDSLKIGRRRLVPARVLREYVRRRAGEGSKR